MKLVVCVLISALGVAYLWVMCRRTIQPENNLVPAPTRLAATQQPAGTPTPPVTIQPVPTQPGPTELQRAGQTQATGLSQQFPGPVRTVLEAQVALVRAGISPGVIDGIFGPQTSVALAVYQRTHGLAVTGTLDGQTKTALALTVPPLTNYIVTSNDMARLQPLSSTWRGKAQQTALEYETVLELVAEQSFSHPDLIRRLNPQVDWANVREGTTLLVPNVSHPTNQSKAAFIRISLSGKWLEAFDAATNLLAHFPCSIAKQVDKRPVGELHVTTIVPNPNYTFDPANFPESPEARTLAQKLVLPPGPNNPVGVAWIGLDKPGYGIHGTPTPERVGRTESHGCFRLANWNAEYLLKLVWIGMPVFIEP